MKLTLETMKIESCSKMKETKFKQTEIGKIPEDWEIYFLKDIADVIDSLHQTPTYSKKGYPMIRVKDIDGGFLKLENALRVDEKVFREYTKKYMPKKGDIIFSRVGSYGLASYTYHDRQFCLGQNTAIISAKQNSKYLYYSLKSPQVKKQIEQVVVGSNQRTISLKNIKELKIPSGNTIEQNRIANILFSFDEKIQLNQRMNKILESIAQAIFKHWFVDFEFPNEEGKPYKSSGGEMVYNEELGKEIPKGWKAGIFGDIIKEKRIRIGNRKAQVLSAIKTGELVHSEDFFDKQVYSKNIKKYLEVTQFDFAYNPSRINIGSIGMLKEDILGAVSPAYVVFKPRDNFHYFIENQLKTNFVKAQIDKFCSGTVRQSLKFEGFQLIKIAIPPMHLVLKFSTFFENLLKQKNAIKNQIITLSQIRDALLPKLMSGEIRVRVDENDIGGER